MSKLPSEEELLSNQSKILDNKCKQIFNPKAEEQRIRQARKATQFYKGKSHPIFGKHIGSIPMNEYYALNRKYGVGFSNDKEFVKYLNNKVLMPNGMAANKI
jgi:hypothetical protein|tara:strand:+ start:5955 stop:6260 length:306 start_codon:yes stop_codon:yes gene_type:complete